MNVSFGRYLDFAWRWAGHIHLALWLGGIFSVAALAAGIHFQITPALVVAGMVIAAVIGFGIGIMVRRQLNSPAESTKTQSGAAVQIDQSKNVHIGQLSAQYTGRPALTINQSSGVKISGIVHGQPPAPAKDEFLIEMSKKK